MHETITHYKTISLGLPTYYFSVRLYSEAHNTNVSDKTSVETQLCGSVKKQNGELGSYMNYGFEGDNHINGSNKVKSKKTRAPLPPSGFEEKIDTAEIQQELDKFDEMLDEVANDLRDNAQHRFSVDSVSLSDVNVSREENVIAVVHHDNIFPPDEPIIPLSLDHHNNNEKNNLEITNIPEIIFNEKKQNSAVLEVIDENVPEPLEPSLSDQNSTDASNNQYKELIQVESDDSKLLEGDKSLLPFDSEALETKDSPPFIIPPPPPPLPSEDFSSKLPLTPPSSPIISSNITNRHHSPDFASQRQKVTTANLQSVRLRPPKKNNKEDAISLFVPDDDNLKVGSDKYKTFMANLDEKLKEVRVLPNYIPFVGKKNPDSGNVTPIEKVANENVIEDNINREEAREKLESYIDSLVEKTKEHENQIKKFHPRDEEKKEVNTHKVTFNKLAEDAVSNISNTSNDENDYMTHKNRMKNVFRSINLKHTDSFKESGIEKPRNINSWGFATEDKVKHRMAMDDIFKTIKLRRKESEKK